MSAITYFYEALPTELKNKKVTDDAVVAFRNNVYYVNLHFKDLEANDERFSAQWIAFQNWMETHAANHRVVLTADLNTELNATCNGVRFTSKKEGTYSPPLLTTHFVRVSQTQFYSTNKMRLFTAQITKMLKAAAYHIDYVFVFDPHPHCTTLPSFTTKQITIENGVLAERQSEHFAPLAFPSDHDPVIYGKIATFNSCFSYGSFDPAKNNISYNTFEFIPAEYLDYFTKHAEDIMKSKLFCGEKSLKELEKQFSADRAPIFDIHLHPNDMPYITFENHGVSLRYPDNCTRYDPNRVEVWMSHFRKLSNDKIKQYLPLWETWRELLTKHATVFSEWYEKANCPGISKLAVLDYLLTQSNVVGLQEILPSDKEFLQNKYDIVFRPQTTYSTETIGAIVFADSPSVLCDCLLS